MEVAVSILSEKDNYKEAVNKLNKTTANYLHLDIMDGSFTSNSSFNISESKDISSITNRKLDIHIMSKNLDIINDYIMLNPSNITFHVENNNIEKYINIIKGNSIKVGLAINPDTDIKTIIPYLDKIDIVLVMSVIPGKGGQEFIKDVVQKVKYLYNIKNNYNYKIEIDGGINNETINLIKDYVDIVVSGSYITKSMDYQNSIDNLYS